MSRIGKKSINIADGVEVKLDKDLLVVKGPKGELTQKVHHLVTIEINDKVASVKVNDEKDKSQRALWGLFASLLINMIEGVTAGFSKQLEINGIGFKANVTGKKMVLNVGYSHPVEYDIPEGIEVKVEGNVITVSGFDKQLVGEVAAYIRRVKPSEPYKGKGIKYVGEEVRRKAGKTAGSKDA